MCGNVLFIVLLYHWHETNKNRWILILNKTTLSSSIATSNKNSLLCTASNNSTIKIFIHFSNYILVLGIWFSIFLLNTYLTSIMHIYILYKPKIFIVLLHSLTTKPNTFAKRSKSVLISLTSTICK